MMMGRRLCKSCHPAKHKKQSPDFLYVVHSVSPLICIRSPTKNFSWAASCWMKVVYPNSQWLVKTFMHGDWIRHRIRPPLPQLRNALVGYIVSFVACMSFVLGTSNSGFVFIVRRPEFQIPKFHYFVVIIALFACSVTRSNSSNWEEHSSVRTP